MHGLTGAALVALRTVYRPDAFNVGWNLGEVAGGSITGHLHEHVVPRWAGDTNFMPVLADVKVLPEHLHATRDTAHGRLARVVIRELAENPERPPGALPGYELHRDAAGRFAIFLGPGTAPEAATVQRVRLERGDRRADARARSARCSVSEGAREPNGSSASRARPATSSSVSSSSA